MRKDEHNYAFIDSQNLNLGIQRLGWKLDWQRFRVYLHEKYAVEKAYCFLGFMPGNQPLYTFLQSVGFVLDFKPVLSDGRGKAKGNVDADLVLRAMIDFDEYDRAVIVTSDGDFYSLVQHLYAKEKLAVVLSPERNNTSKLLRNEAKGKIQYLADLEHRLAYRQKK